MLVPDALRFAYPGVGIEFGHGEKLVAGLCDGALQVRGISAM